MTIKQRILRVGRRQTGLRLAWVTTQGRPVAHQPDVPERICEPALPMGWRLVILDIVKSASLRRWSVESSCAEHGGSNNKYGIFCHGRQVRVKRQRESVLRGKCRWRLPA
jgi:hypothetical protein